MLLPAYDEFIIAYKDRSAILLEEHRKKMITSNGIFWPAIVLDGQVMGKWKRVVTRDKLQVSFDYFHPATRALAAGVKKISVQLGRFLQIPIDSSGQG